MQQLFGGTEPSGGYTASGASAQVTVDGVNYTFASNQFTINGVSYTLQGTTGPSNPAFIAVTNNVSSAVSAIQNFVTAYNNTLTALNNMLTEQNYHQLPLTQDEITAKNLTDTEIDDWNTKAKSGLLNGDPLLTSVVNNMQNAMITPVSGLSGQVTVTSDNLQQVTAACNQMGVIGITSTYGTLSLDTDKLTEALQSNPQAVIDLFTKTLDSNGRLITDSSQQGLAVRLYNTLSSSIAQITNEAGSSSDLFDNSYIGREIAADNSQISNWNSRLSDLEKRYYTEFNNMEQMLSEMNVQSAWLSQMFSSGSSSGG
jgi:flagellar hook-associated protein 2